MNNPFQPYLRDVMAMSRHIFMYGNNPVIAEFKWELRRFSLARRHVRKALALLPGHTSDAVKEAIIQHNVKRGMDAIRIIRKLASETL